MTKHFKTISKYLLALGIIAVILSNSSNPPNGRTGAPGDGLCSGCHTGDNFEGSVIIDGLPGEVQSGESYTITVRTSNTDNNAIRAGFQVVSLFNEEFTNAGMFDASPSDVGSTVAGGREYIEHRGPKNFQGGIAEWIFDWEAPLVDSEDEIVFFGASVIGNGSGSSGDAVRTFEQAVTIRPPVMDLELTIEGNEILCNGESTNLEARVTGGVAPYNYNWSNGATTATNEAVFAGEYSVTVSDANDSMKVASIEITEPEVIAIDLDITPESDNDASDGLASAIVSGGVPPYNFEWSNDETTETIAGLTEGTYSLLVTDNNGCTSTISFDIESLGCDFELNLEFTQISCIGANDGEATIDPTGFVQPLNFEWSNGDDSFIAIAGLSPGEYAITVTDGSACTVVENFVIEDPLPIEITLFSLFPDCTNPAINSLNTLVQGGSGTYSYQWSNGETTETIENIVDGAYSVTVTDSNGCSETGAIDFTFEDTEGPIITFDNNATVYVDSLGMIDLSPLSIEVIDNCGVSTEGFVGDFNCDSLGARIVEYTATDVNDNTSTVAIQIAGIIDTFPPRVVCVDDIIQDGCDTIFYDLPLALDNCNIAEMELAEGLPSGSVFPKDSTKVTYNYYDEAGNFACCSFWVVVSNDLTLSIDNVTNSTASNDGSIDITVGGGSGNYTFEWTLDDTIVVSSFEDPTGLSAGAYIVKVTDETGCIISSDAVLIQLQSSVSDADLPASKVYPNPTAELLNVEFEGNLEAWSLMSINGQVVQNTRTPMKAGYFQIDLIDYESGMYFLNLQFEGRSQILKVIKK